VETRIVQLLDLSDISLVEVGSRPVAGGGPGGGA